MATEPRYLRRNSAPHLSTLILLASMTALTMNVFLPALPQMAEHFDTPYNVMQLSVAIFLGANGFLQIFIGPLSDKFGRRPVILGGLGIFCVATLGCIYAPNITVFLIMRVVQAAVAVAMVLSRAVVRDMNSADRAASTMGYVIMGMSVVPMIAPALGGVLSEAYGWQSTFWALLVGGLIVMAISWADLGETGTRSSLSLGQQFREYPELLTSPRFWGYCMAAAFSSAAFFVFLGGAPLIANQVFRMAPAEFGYYTAAPAVGYFLGNWITGVSASRMGVNRMVICGTVVTAGGMLVAVVLTMAGLGGKGVFFGSMAFVGLGNGLAIPSASSGMLSVRPHLAGTASGLGGAIQIGGGAIMAALAGLILTPGTTELPLLALMAATGVAGFASILLVILRERQIQS